jgi:CubicO group peptidase (beta-lactamase class C family)
MKTDKKSKFVKILPLLLLTVFCLATVTALIPRIPPAPASVDNLAGLESYLQSLTSGGNPPGLSLVVVKDNSIIYNQAFGYADQPGEIIATPDTVYHWWSTTKIFTATAIFQLAETGKLNLDDPVVDYLPFFQVEYPSTESLPITTRHILNHSSGLPDNIPAVVGWMHFEDQANFDQTDLLIKYLPHYSKLLFEPGTQSRYTNVGYMVLGAIIEQVSGRTYEEYIHGHILSPLKMDQTDFVYRESMLPYAAVGMHPLIDLQSAFLPFYYNGRLSKLIREVKDGKMWINRIHADSNPPTGLIGPAEDLARFVEAHLNNGEFDGYQMLSATSIHEMMTASHITTQGGQIETAIQGLGWEICGQDENFCLQRRGDGPGFGNVIRLYPESSLGFVITANSTNIDRDGLMDLVVGLDW